MEKPDLEKWREQWRGEWPAALAAWRGFTKLSEPRWCLDKAAEKKEELTGSFAMIRLTDHAVVISLRQAAELGLGKFAAAILAHEIGHHVYAPGDLADNARLLARIRMGLPTRETYTGVAANLYTDLLINDRLQRGAGLDMSGVYKALRRPGDADRLWTLYMRIYEVLWGLPSGTLAGPGDAGLQTDAVLGARLLRAYSKNWLGGAGRFAALLLPYFLELPPDGGAAAGLPWLDTGQAGAGDVIPDGLAGIDEEEAEGAIHPSEDPALSGLEGESVASAPRSGGGRELRGGQKNNYRSPAQYRELMASAGVKAPEREMVARYYRERALPFLVRFPVKEAREATEPQPEGLETWDTGMPLQEIDWSETLARGSEPVPGVTTVRRTYGETEGASPAKIPLDLYIGIDCSGSMANPAAALSYPVLAGTVLALSALRAGARVKVCLSGEPGEYSETDGFIRDEREILRVLTGYLGTGYSFGIARLEDTFLKEWKARRPVHILVVSDSDIFHMLKELRDGWEIAAGALKAAGGGGTFVLEIPGRNQETARLEALGWAVSTVNGQEELLAFARAFSRANYGRREAGGAKAGARGGAA